MGEVWIGRGRERGMGGGITEHVVVRVHELVDVGGGLGVRVLVGAPRVGVNAR